MSTHRTYDGKPLRDAVSMVAFKVTDEHSIIGNPRDEEHCPAANGLVEHWNGDQEIKARVCLGVTYVSEPWSKYSLRFMNSPVLETTIRSFDNLNQKATFPEGEYQLLPPTAAQKLGKRAGTKPGSATRKGKARSLNIQSKRAKPTRDARRTIGEP